MSCGVAPYHHHQQIVDGTDKPTHGTDEAVHQAAQKSSTALHTYHDQAMSGSYELLTHVCM